jgi:AcrR family transcriptional regulator
MVASAKVRESTRDRIVAAAARLFYGDGIRATSVEAIAERAGISKKTLYYHFASKDDLVEAYLQSQDQPVLDLYARWFTEAKGDTADKIAGIFASFAAAASSPRWRGCGFHRTVAELANTPGHPAVKAGAAHKKRFEAWLRQVLTEAGIANPRQLATRILLLLDGASTVMLIHRDADYVKAAGRLAAELVAAAARVGNVTTAGTPS